MAASKWSSSHDHAGWEPSAPPDEIDRAAAWASFHAGLEPTELGWNDLAAGILLLDTS